MKSGQLRSSELLLSPCVNVEVTSDGVMLFNERFVVHVKSRSHAVRAEFAKLRGGAAIPSGLISEVLCDKLTTHGFFVSSLPTGLPDYLSRIGGYLVSYGGDGAGAVQRLRSSSVVIVGLGGTGAQIALHLAASGVGAMHLVDGDVVNRDNLNRQHPYTGGDVGELKTAALSRHLGDLCGDSLTVTTRSIFVESVEQMCGEVAPESSLLVLAADRPAEIETIVGRACHLAKVPVLSAAVGIFTGHVGPLTVPGRTPCLACAVRQMRGSDDDRRVRTMRAVGPTHYSSSPTNALIAAAAAREALHHLAGLEGVTVVGRRTVIDFDSYSHRTVWYSDRPCACHR